MPLAQKAKPTTIKLPLKKIMKGTLAIYQVQIVDQERCIRYLLDINYEKQKLGNLLFARSLEVKMIKGVKRTRIFKRSQYVDDVFREE